MNTKEYRLQLANEFVHILEEKQLDWKKEWQGNRAKPTNARTGRAYHGINSFYLTMIAVQRGYMDPRWATFNQIRDSGWHLKNAKGQGVTVEYWYPYDLQLKKMTSWEEFKISKEEFGERYVLRAIYTKVFNASLIEGIPNMEEKKRQEILPDQLIEALSSRMNVPILHDGGDQAYYSIQEDRIHLPHMEDFYSEYAYNSTALHELGHSTGARHRLNRNVANIFGSPEYAFEELIAEITSCFLSAELSIPQAEGDIGNHKAYVQNWIQTIREKPEKLAKAIQQAEKATAYMEYMAGLIPKKEFDILNRSSAEALTVPGYEADNFKTIVSKENTIRKCNKTR